MNPARSVLKPGKCISGDSGPRGQLALLYLGGYAKIRNSTPHFFQKCDPIQKLH